MSIIEPLFFFRTSAACAGERPKVSVVMVTLRESSSPSSGPLPLSSSSSESFGVAVLSVLLHTLADVSDDDSSSSSSAFVVSILGP